MNFRSVAPEESISLYVKNILVFEETQKGIKTVLPFFADGYPGLVFHQTANGMRVNPHNKLMPPLFLYGQTIKPIELEMEGSYRMIVFQLYPFVLKRLFRVQPKDLNDDCYDLRLQFPEATGLLEQEPAAGQQVSLIRSLLINASQANNNAPDPQIRQAILLILENNGLVTIKNIAETMHLTSRTLERRFNDEVGVSPKQFAQIIRFQLSLEQLTVKDYEQLSDIVHRNGFADQSHFIRVFKTYTGQTPKKFQPERR